jgi:DNA-binding NarL/FixJ family response regulator
VPGKETAGRPAGRMGRLGGRIPATVLIADTDEAARAELARLLGAAGYEVVHAADGEDALALARERRPSVAILEIPLSVLSGYEVCRALKSEFGPDLPVLFLSGHRTESYDRVAGLLVGADDYLVKPYAADELLAKVRMLTVRPHPVSAVPSSSLTRREAEVLGMLAEGLSQRDIAVRLTISPKTVGTHIEHVLRKLGVHSRAQAVALILRGDGTKVVSGAHIESS